jgi:hypothetical protein
VQDTIDVTNKNNITPPHNRIDQYRQPRVSFHIAILMQAHHEHQTCTDRQHPSITSGIIIQAFMQIHHGLRLKAKTCYGHKAKSENMLWPQCSHPWFQKHMLMQIISSQYTYLPVYQYKYVSILTLLFSIRKLIMYTHTKKKKKIRKHGFLKL